MKKSIVLMLILAICLALFSGCSSSAKPKSLEKSMNIPDSGVISASVFEKLNNDNKIITFLGKDGDYTYYWTVYGSNFRTFEDANLKIAITKETDREIGFETVSKKDFAFSPNLSICLKGKKNISKANLYKDKKLITEVFVSFKNENTVLNFKLTAAGQYTVRFDLSQDENGNDKQFADKKSANDNQKSGQDSEKNASDSCSGAEDEEKSEVNAGIGNDTSVSAAEKGQTEKTNSVKSAKNSGEKGPTVSSSESGEATRNTVSKNKENSDKKPSEKTNSPNAAQDNTAASKKNADKNTGGNVSSKAQGGSNSSGEDKQTNAPDNNQPDNTFTEPSAEAQNTCTISINCSTIFNNLTDLNPDKFDVLPDDGWILETVTVSFNEGESVYDVLCRVCSDYGLHIDSEYTPLYGSYYVKALGNLYEMDCGEGSGWMYSVDGVFPNYGCSKYILKNGQNIEFKFTCDFGADVGDEFY